MKILFGGDVFASWIGKFISKKLKEKYGVDADIDISNFDVSTVDNITRLDATFNVRTASNDIIKVLGKVVK